MMPAVVMDAVVVIAPGAGAWPSVETTARAFGVWPGRVRKSGGGEEERGEEGETVRKRDQRVLTTSGSSVAIAVSSEEGSSMSPAVWLVLPAYRRAIQNPFCPGDVIMSVAVWLLLGRDVASLQADKRRGEGGRERGQERQRASGVDWRRRGGRCV